MPKNKTQINTKKQTQKTESDKSKQDQAIIEIKKNKNKNNDTFVLKNGIQRNQQSKKTKQTNLKKN